MGSRPIPEDVLIGSGWSAVGLRILLADDDRDMQLVARLALRRAGFSVEAVGDGEAALRHAAADPPDAIVLDWMMPGLEGPEVCARLKADPTTAAIPVIFLTGKTDSVDAERGRALGAVGVIAKPFDPLALGGQVRALLERG
ncbi:MAG: response regulator [Vicinamibacteraceae bacterium]|nr:response regulator [Vicinamibacteraceae bacterium]